MGARLGQHFLKNLKSLSFIKHLSGEILEIGAGDGRVTKLLIKRGNVHAVELDERLCEKLRELPVHLICGDFLEVEPFPVDYIVGNIPYYISSPILFRLRDWEFKKAYLMFQKEFGEKLLAKAGDKNYGRLSVMFQAYFKGRIIRHLPRHYFTPPPKVDSVIVEIEKVTTPLPDYFEDLVRLLFSQRNKKVKNILKGWDIPEEVKEMRPRHMGLKDILKIKPHDNLSRKLE